MRTYTQIVLATLAVLTLLLPTAAPVLAGAPQFSDGRQLQLSALYQSPQTITDIFTDHAVYGKLQGTTPIDLYQFTPDRDGEQRFQFLGQGVSASSQPLLILVDPTDASPARQLGIPVPSDNYHTALIAPVTGEQFLSERWLFTRYTVLANDTVKLQKGVTYYFLVFDPSRLLSSYVIKIGNGPAWSGSDVFRHFGGWLRVKTDSYAASSPFTFPVQAVGLLLFILSLAILIGMWLVEQAFSFLANRTHAAGELLVKMQPFSRVVTWISLWFLLLGGYIYFNKVGWTGLPFVLGVLYLPILVVFLLQSLYFSPRLMAVKEGAIPFALRQKLFFNTVATLLSLAAFVTILTMYLTR